MWFDDIINPKKSIAWLGIKSDLSGWLTKASSRNKFSVKNVSILRLIRNISLEIWIGYIYNWDVTLASQMSKRYIWYFSKYSHSRFIAIRHGCKLKQISKHKLKILWTIIADKYWGKCIFYVNRYHIHVWLNEGNDIDGFHLKVLIVGKLIKFFQIQYHPLIAFFFVCSKNTRNKFTFIWCTLNNN